MLYKRIFKRVLDVTAASIAITITSPVLMLTTACLLYVNKGRPFFLQARPGKNEKIFKIIKFKTMKDLHDANGRPLPDKDRITKVGQIVRQYSIDELPQMFNVLKGDMSLIGPRPLLVQYLPLYSDFQKRRHEVKPGITGWTQVNGRNSIPYEKRMELDTWYAEHHNVVLDIWIILKTFKVLLFPDKGIYDLNSSSPVE
jgi:lipopolysaccharide/colanic/teichoic acid biosynthesis glycosyltransferase